MEKLVNNLLNCVKVEMQTQIEARMRRKITKLLLCSRSWKILYILQKAKMGSISPTPKPRRITTQILLKQEVGRNSCKMCEKNVFKLIYVKANWREFQIGKLLKVAKKVIKVIGSSWHWLQIFCTTLRCQKAWFPLTHIRYIISHRAFKTSLLTKM